MEKVNNPMAELLRKIEEYQACVKRMDAFLEDVMPQVGSLCIQDFQNLNELCMSVGKLKGE